MLHCPAQKTVKQLPTRDTRCTARPSRPAPGVPFDLIPPAMTSNSFQVLRASSQYAGRPVTSVLLGEPLVAAAEGPLACAERPLTPAEGSLARVDGPLARAGESRPPGPDFAVWNALPMYSVLAPGYGIAAARNGLRRPGLSPPPGRSVHFLRRGLRGCARYIRLHVRTGGCP